MSKLYDYSKGITDMETQVGLPAIPHRQFVTPLPEVYEEPPPPSPAYMSKLTSFILIGLTLGLVISIVIIGLTIIR